MAPKATKGKCILCSKEYTRAGMAKHLAKCLTNDRNATKGKLKPCLHLQVSTHHYAVYWLHLQIDANTAFKTLDNFLRDIWLECCGHMSMFHIGWNEIGMSRKISQVLDVGATIDYDYDMGDTTELQIKVMRQYTGWVVHGMPVQLLARNHAPEILCDECGDHPAKHICPFCQWEGEGWLCDACAAQHDCEEYEDEEGFFLPVVNSPRAGVCAYGG